MNDLLNQKADITNDSAGVIPEDYTGNVELDAVKFVYPGGENPVVDEMSLKIPAGKMVAFVGKSGEGKTTLIRLLARMYDVTSGRIRLDGQDIREVDLYWYRRQSAPSMS